MNIDAGRVKEVVSVSMGRISQYVELAMEVHSVSMIKEDLCVMCVKVVVCVAMENQVAMRGVQRV